MTPAEGSGRSTLLEVLRLAEGYLAQRGVDGARLSAEHLLAEVLGLDRLGLYLAFDRPLVEAELEAFRVLVRRRATHEPLQYILGRTGFRGLTIGLGPGVLVPRPETEQLVQLVLDRLQETALRTGAGANERIRVLDLCTGSGAVGLSLAAEREGLWCLLSDRSAGALRWAGKNLELCRETLKSPAVLCLADLALAFGDRPFFHAVVSNPPYVAPEELGSLPEEIRGHEPLEALDGGAPDGTAVIARILDRVPPLMLPGGLLALEIGESQEKSLAGLFERRKERLTPPEFFRDLAGKVRFVCAMRK